MLGLSYAARSVQMAELYIFISYTLINLVVSMNFLCSNRAGNELGAGHPKVARFSVIIVVAASIAFSVLVTFVVLILRYPLSTLYTSSTTVIDAVISLMPLLSISIFLNGIQPIL